MAEEVRGAPLRDRVNVQRFQSYRFSRDIEAGLRLLTKANNCKAWQAVAEDWILLALGISMILYGIRGAPWWLALLLVPLGWLLVGARMRGLATLLHEGAHRALARSTFLNLIIGSALSGWWILQLYGRYVRSHVKRHHPYLGNADLDPDTAQYIRLRLLRQNPRNFVWRNTAQLLCGMKTLVNLPYLLRDRLLPESGTRLTAAEKIEATGFVVAWAAVLVVLAWNGWLDEFAIAWVVPYLTSFQAINWAIETSEHFPLIWTRAADIDKTRNRKGPAIEQFFFGTHGESWHRVHHLRPGIPFYNLGKAHVLMMKDPTYASAEASSGGLFLPGPTGGPPIFRAIAKELACARQD